MIKVLMKCNFWLESITESKPKEERTLLSKIILNSLKLICRYSVFVVLLLKKIAGLNKVEPLVDDKCLPIVSLTTFPARINNLWMVLYCMYQQSIRPGKIVVILVNDEIKGGIGALPKSLMYYRDKGVEFLFEDENLRPHNKYFYTRQKYAGRNIITIDDDLLYYFDTIERLLEIHKKYPDCVCSNRIQRIRMSKCGFEASNDWELIHTAQEPAHHWLALGYSAVFYPHSFITNDIYNIEKIKSLSLMADDMWLMVQEMIAGVKVVNGNYYAHPMTLPSSQKIALQKENNAIDSRNDKYLKLLVDNYKEILFN